MAFRRAHAALRTPRAITLARPLLLCCRALGRRWSLSIRRQRPPPRLPRSPSWRPTCVRARASSSAAPSAPSSRGPSSRRACAACCRPWRSATRPSCGSTSSSYRRTERRRPWRPPSSLRLPLPHFPPCYPWRAAVSHSAALAFPRGASTSMSPSIREQRHGSLAYPHPSGAPVCLHPLCRALWAGCWPCIALKYP